MFEENIHDSGEVVVLIADILYVELLDYFEVLL